MTQDTMTSGMRSQHGASLVEVLVAAVVMAFGLLGLAAMQARSMQATQSSDLRSQATVLAYDMSDRMRANLNGWRAGDYDTPTATNNHCSGSGASACTAAQLAAHDYFEWTQTLSAALPGGSGIVCVDSTPDDGDDGDSDGSVSAAEAGCDGAGSGYAVKLWWRDEREDPDAERVRLVTAFSP